jgi:ribose/xylose/arabinose/galactoside ABC-type transport system permease subunit
MRTAWVVMRWALFGSFLAGTLTTAGFVIFDYDQLLGPKDADEIQAWARFSALMGSLAMAAVGFVIGAVYGVFRARTQMC